MRIHRGQWARSPKKPTFGFTFDVHRQHAYPGCIVIIDFRDKRTRLFAQGKFVKAFSGFEDQASKRLSILNAVTSKEDLRALPSNRFEALGDDRERKYSTRSNRQWRICFEWVDGAPGPSKVEITDYH